jgi:parallel beta-helix repeat protein
MNLMSLDQHDI